jgi:hypothetical protein
MTATHPISKPRRLPNIVHLSIAIVLLLSSALFNIGVEERQKHTIADEFESKRSLILSRIDNAVDRQDLDTLTRINNKYSGCVSDGTFQSAIREALAKVTAREAALELAVSRHLDLLRHQEESLPNYDTMKPQIPAAKQVAEQPLSKLPR